MLRKAITCILLLAFGFTSIVPNSLAADHIVKAEDLQKAIDSAAQIRQGNLQKAKAFFGTALGQQVLQKAGVEFAKVEKALPQLSDEELARLVASTDEAQSQFAAGYHIDTIYLLLIILLVVAIVVIVASAVD